MKMKMENRSKCLNIVNDPGVEETKGHVSSDDPTDDEDHKNTSPVLGMTFVPI